MSILGDSWEKTQRYGNDLWEHGVGSDVGKDLHGASLWKKGWGDTV